jgi:hypothetical protein
MQVQCFKHTKLKKIVAKWNANVQRRNTQVTITKHKHAKSKCKVITETLNPNSTRLRHWNFGKSSKVPSTKNKQAKIPNFTPILPWLTILQVTIYIKFLIFRFDQIHDIWSGSWYPDPELPVLTLKSRFSSFCSKQPLISGSQVFEYLKWKMVRASPPVHSMWLHTVQFNAKKSKLVFCTKFVQLAMVGKGATQLCTSKKSVTNWTWLRLSISDWLIIMIGPGGLLLVVPTYMQFQLQFYWWGCHKKNS